MSGDNDGFWDQGPGGDDGDEIVRGRYRLPHPITGAVADWTRVTNFNQTTRDSHGLTQWRLYQLLTGLSQRPDLMNLVRTLDPDDRRQMREIIAQADAVAGTDAKANEGNAVHRALALADAAQYYPPEFEPYVRAYRAELTRNGLAVVPGMIEVTLCNLDLGVVGTADRFLVDAAGRVLTGDLKSGRLDLAELEHRIQFACYGTATHYMLPGDRTTWQPMPVGEHAVSDEIAVLVKIDLEQQSVCLYTVDLVAGRRSANLARQVREDRKVKGTLLPYVPPTQPLTPALIRSQALDRDAPGDGTRRVVDGVVQVYQLGEWMDEHPQPVENGQRHLQVVPAPVVDPTATPIGEVRFRPDGAAVTWNGQVWTPTGQTADQALDPGTMAVAGGLRDDGLAPPAIEVCGTCTGPRQTREQLKKLDKAGLQQLCRAHGVVENLSKNKDPLVSYLAGKGHVIGETAGLVVPPGRTPRLNDPQEIAGPIGGSDPTDPRDEAFTALRLARIGAAKSVNELGQVHAEVVRLGGQQAWNERLDAAAKSRATQLEPQGSPAPSPIAEDDPFRMIDGATTAEDLGQIWSLVTLGGTQGERWTTAVGEYAQARLTAIQSAAHPPAVNPFAGAGVTP